MKYIEFVPENFSNTFKELRIQRGLSQSQLTAELGLSKLSTIRNYERGINLPERRMLIKLAKFFKIKWILG